METKYLNKFSGLYFLGYREKSDYKDAGIIITPISYEGTCSLGLGTKNGPEAILKASLFTEPFDEESNFSLEDIGMHTLKIQKFSDQEAPKKVIDEVRKITSSVLEDKKFPVAIGGEHSISIGTIQAISEKKSNLSVLQIDAHTDLDERYNGQKYHHATMARTVKETTPVTITQVGIRSCIEPHLEYAKENNISVFFAHDIINKKHRINEIAKTLRKNVYITLDIDAFDPSIFPNTGTPEPNGLKWQYVVNLINQISKIKNIVGIDVVEHSSENPKKAHYSDYSAAKLLHKVLCIVFKNKASQKN